MDRAPSRVVIERVRPEVDCGRFPSKAIVGDRVVVTADVFAEGHDVVRAVLVFRKAGTVEWQEVSMEPLPNDLWRAEFLIETLESYQYTIEAWVDPFRTWLRDLRKRVASSAATGMDLRIGAELVARAVDRASGTDARQLEQWATNLERASGEEGDERFSPALSPELADLVDRWPDRTTATRYPREVQILVERERARFSAWYEMFPRSASSEPGKHGTLKDCIARLPYVAAMGFDVLYLPPVHPIGHTHRKGRNNDPIATPEDVGSPWAIGASEGGHTAIHPSLGTLDDFRCLLGKAREHGLELALDLAYQCSPDHPWVREHPEWFRRRPDGTIQYAENPPKKYQDIFPLYFEARGLAGPVG